MRKIKLSNIHRFFKIDDKYYKKVSKYKWRYTKSGSIICNIYDKKSGLYNSKTLCSFLFPKNKYKEKFFLDGNPFNFQKNNVIFFKETKDLTEKRLKRANRDLKIRESNRLTKYRGVSRNNKNSKKISYSVGINYKNKFFYLGTYGTKEEAALAYDKKARELYGKKARLNFP